ncbi:MAG: methyltransferase domain-containing protein [Verrucomicrobiota bacterium]
MDWNQRYLENDTPWDKGKPAPPLVEFLEKNSITGHVLIPGCGLGHDVRLLSQHGTKALGMDLSQQAIEQAQAIPSTGFINYVKADFTKLPGHFHARFDWLFEHTLFCAIEPHNRSAYAASAAQCLKAQGKFLAIFYLTPGADSPPPYPSSQEEINTLFTPYFTILEKWQPTNAYPSREGKELVFLMQKI